MDMHEVGESLELPSIKRKAKLAALPGFISSKVDNDPEIDQLIALLDKSTKQRKTSQFASPAQDATLSVHLENIMQKVWELSDPKDKIHWLQRGLLQALINAICVNTRRAQSNATAIEICKGLVFNNREGSSMFCRHALAHLASDNECIGISDCLAQLISVFIEELGVAKLLDIYANISVEYNPDQGVSREAQIKESVLPKDDTDIPLNPINRYFSAPSLLAQGDDALRHLDNILPNTLNPSPLGSPGGFHTPSPPGSFSNKSLSPVSPPKSPFGYNGTLTSVHLAEGLLSGVSVDGTRAPFYAHSSPHTDATRPRAASLAMMKPVIPSSSLPPVNPKPIASPNAKPSSRPPVPRLNLPLRVESVGKMTRSSRRLEEVGSSSNRGAPTSNDVEFVQTASKEFNDLATKLDMAADLTALLSYKQVIDAQASRATSNGMSNTSGGSKGYLAKKPIHVANEILGPGYKSPLRAEMVALRNSSAYRVKTSILRVLALVTAQPSILKYIHSPVNILYTELVEIYHNLMPADDEYKVLIYKILANWADYVEYLHRHRWREITKGMSVYRKESFRKKLDKFLWRIHNNLFTHLENEDYTDVNVLLSILGEYMQHCPTRVMSSQVVDVCMETLLKIKHLAFNRGKFSAERLYELRTMHNLLVVFDSIAEQIMQHHHPLNDLLLAVFVEREDTFTQTKQYAAQVLFGHSIESEMLRDPASGHITLTDFRVRVVKHFEVCVDMIQRAQDAEQQYDNPHTRTSDSNSPGSSKSNGSSEYSGIGNHKSTISELLRKFEFLLLPGSGGGYIMQFLSQNSHYDGYLVKRQMLQLLCKIFEFKGNPFVRRKQYIDAYVSYFYTRFIKLYHSYVLDGPTLEMCRLHLRLLLAFSLCKAEKVAMKFYQLRAMDFLVREISLEYEVKLNRELKDNIPFFIPPRGHKSKPKPEQSTAISQATKGNSRPSTKINLSALKIGNTDDSSDGKEKDKEDEKEKITAMKLPALRVSGTGSDDLKSLPAVPSLKLGTILAKNQDGDTSSDSNTNSTSNNNSSSNNTKKLVPSLKLGAVIKEKAAESPVRQDSTKHNLVLSLKLGIAKDNDAAGNSNSSAASTNPPDDVAKKGKLVIAIPSLKLPVGARLNRDNNDVQQDMALGFSPNHPGLLSGLSAIEKKIDLHDPKFQLLLDNPVVSVAIPNSSTSESTSHDRPPTPADLLAENQRYANERNNRKLYHDKDLHIALLQLVFSLMITQKYGTQCPHFLNG